MKVFRRILPAVLVVLAFSVAGYAFDTVHTDYDKKADFSHYKTYSWVKVQTSNPLGNSALKTL